MQYKAEGKTIYQKKKPKGRWEILRKTISSLHAKKTVKRLELEKNEWKPKKK